MTFDNSKTIFSIKIRTFIITIVLIFWTYFAYFGKELKFPLFGLSEGIWTLIVFSIYILLIVYPVLLKYKYIYFSDDGPIIILRFYSAGFFKGKRQSVEIPKNELVGYNISKYLGVLKLITLNRKIDLKTLKYPPIYLGSLKRYEIKKITNSLDEYLQK